MQQTIETPKQYQCRHIFTDGHRCSSPCLRREEFCYYHHNTRKPVSGPRQRRSRRSTFDMPLPDDRSAIQHSIGQVLRRIASNDIDPRRAGLLLYGLQIASLNLPRPQSTHRNSAEQAEPTVEEITTDPTLGVLAPRTEIAREEERLSVVGALLKRFDSAEFKDRESPKSAVLPTIQAADESCILTMHAQTHRSHHPGRLGLPPRDPRQRHSPGPQTRLRQAPPRIPQHTSPGQRPLRRSPRRPDGQLRGRPPQPRRRSHRPNGHDPHRHRHPRRHPLHRPYPHPRLRTCRAKRESVAPHRSAVRRRRPLPPAPSRRPRPHGRAAQTHPRLHPRLHGRTRHPAHQRPRLPRATPANPPRSGSRPDRQRQRPLLRHGPRPPLGEGEAGLRRLGHRPPRRGQPTPTPSPESKISTTAASPTSSSRPSPASTPKTIQSASSATTMW